MEGELTRLKQEIQNNYSKTSFINKDNRERKKIERERDSFQVSELLFSTQRAHGNYVVRD